MIEWLSKHKTNLFLVIITQTVGQMTDMIPFTTISTQTPLPRTNLSFASLAKMGNPRSDDKTFPFEQQMLENELLLQTQRNALKSMDFKLNEIRSSGSKVSEMNVANKFIVASDVQEDCTSLIGNSQSPPTNTMKHIKIDPVTIKMVINLTIIDHYESFSKNIFRAIMD